MGDTAAPLLERFRRTMPFELDPFQVEAIEKLRSHHGVLVAAPTSSGKTVVADYAIFEALEEGAKAIYTTPLKALSNQKFRDLKKRYGEGWVGLVTGEHTINDQAPVVVMTTEILRNLIYEDPERLREVRYVVLDEVHYIDDYPRGAVWEEIMIQAPDNIKFVGLSATISNYQQVADWMASHRGEMGTVVVRERPVELKLWLAMENRIHTLFDEHGKINRKTWNLAAAGVAYDRRFPRHRGPRSNSLIKVIEELVRQEMVPAIYFIFSRRGCEEALQRCAMRHLDLTDAAEKTRIDAMIQARISEVRDADEAKLYNSLLHKGPDQGRDRHPPRRAPAVHQGAGRGALPGRSDQGGVRHRDPRPGHPHAGARGGDLVIHQVRRPRLPGADLGRADPADGARRPARHRPCGQQG